MQVILCNKKLKDSRKEQTLQTAVLRPYLKNTHTLLIGYLFTYNIAGLNPTSIVRKTSWLQNSITLLMICYLFIPTILESEDAPVNQNYTIVIYPSP